MTRYGRSSRWPWPTWAGNGRRCRWHWARWPRTYPAISGRWRPTRGSWWDRRTESQGSGGLSPGSGPGHLARLDARRAHVQPLGGATTGGRPYRLDVGVPAAPGAPVRVGHVVAKARSLATDVAHASHGYLLGLIRRTGLTEARLRTRVPRTECARATWPGYPMPARDSQSPRTPPCAPAIVGGG